MIICQGLGMCDGDTGCKYCAEIERLRAENVALRQAALTHVKAENAIRAERDRLRDAHDDLLEDRQKLVDDLDSARGHAAVVQAERDRLRDALRELIADCRYHLTLYRSGPLAKAEGTLKGDTPQLCDCELSHNGLGMSGRECDC